MARVKRAVNAQKKRRAVLEEASGYRGQRSRLYRKAKGRPAQLCYMGHALTENRNGFVVEATLTHADGTAERTAAIDMLNALDPGSTRRITLGADKGYDTTDFVADLRAPTPSAAAELVVARKDDFVAVIDRLVHRLQAALSGRLHRLDSRVRALDTRPGFGGFAGHVALRARHVSELAHQMDATVSGTVHARERHYRTLRLTLERLDVRRQFGRHLGERLVGMSAAVVVDVADDHRTPNLLVKSQQLCQLSYGPV